MCMLGRTLCLVSFDTLASKRANCRKLAVVKEGGAVRAGLSDADSEQTGSASYITSLSQRVPVAVLQEIAVYNG
jgi:hypothetical protein